MPIFYALVARGTIVLAEHTARSGNFPTVTRVLLGKISPNADAKMSYIYDEYVFHYQVEDGITYLCLADEKQKRRIPFLFLADIKDRFRATYGDRAKTAIAFAMNAEFSRALADRLEFFNENPGADNFGKVKDQLSEVKDIMVENIEKVLARGEKIELLVDKTDALNQSAKRFQKTSKQLKNVMWWKNVKMWGLIIVVVAIIIWLISSFVCGFNFSKCGAGSSS
jgi:vesicle-associated membrane protein 7